MGFEARKTYRIKHLVHTDFFLLNLRNYVGIFLQFYAITEYAYCRPIDNGGCTCPWGCTCPSMSNCPVGCICPGGLYMAMAGYSWQKGVYMLGGLADQVFPPMERYVDKRYWTF